MQFQDGNRIDLNLVPTNKVSGIMKATESLTEILLDKDGLTPELPPPSDRDYHVPKPSEKEFQATCNEFGGLRLMWPKGFGERKYSMQKVF